MLSEILTASLFNSRTMKCLPHNDCYVVNPNSCYFRILSMAKIVKKGEKQNMNKTIKTIWNAITTVIVIFVVIIAVLLVGVRLVGIRPYTVLSGSMEPTYHVGSLIYVKNVDPFDLKAGDVITYMLDEDTLSTHRIVEVVPDEEDSTVVRFMTKGDANDAVDGSLVHYKNVVGKPIFSIPKLGYVANYIQNPPGTYIAIAMGAILLLLVFIPDLFDDEEEDDGFNDEVFQKVRRSSSGKTSNNKKKSKKQK